MKKYVLGMMVIIIIGLLAACGSDESNNNVTSNQADNSETNDELVPNDEVVAIVNKQEITGKTFNVVSTQFQATTNQMDQELDEEEMKKAILDAVIDRELLIQQAKEEGIEVTEKDTIKEFDQLKESEESNLQTLMEQYKMSEDEFKEQLKFELVLNAFKAKIGEVDVPDKDVEEYYEKAKEGNDHLPPLKEIKSEMKKQLQEKKLNETIQKKIDTIKEKADIEKKLEV